MCGNCCGRRLVFRSGLVGQLQDALVSDRASSTFHRDANAVKKGRPTNVKKSYARADVELSEIVNEAPEEPVDD